jgi:hypothetical protein
LITRSVTVALLLLAAGAFVQPATAGAFLDGATGFAVDPPAPFIVAPSKSKSYDLVVIINSTTGSPSLGAGDNFLCQVGYKRLPDNHDLTQDEINLQQERPARLDGVAETLSRSFDVTGKATFVLNGATGIELIGKPKDTTKAAGVFMSMIETPQGRTTLNCATRPEEIDKAVDQFRLIRASITPPGTRAP